MSDSSYTALASGPAPPDATPAPQTATPAGGGVGAEVMGTPAAPSSHPGNQAAASSTPHHGQPGYYQYPPVPPPAQPPLAGMNPVSTNYVQVSPTTGPLDKISQALTGALRQATEATNSIVSHLQTGGSSVNTAFGKVEQGLKMAFSGGPEHHWRQSFNPPPLDKLVASPFGCYLSTSTGPVAGYLYVSMSAICFASDKPLPYTPSPSQVAYSYYKVVLPLQKIDILGPSITSATEKYVQIVTVDKAEFWFMGFISFEQAIEALQMALANFRSLETPSLGVPAPAPAPAPAQPPASASKGQ
eukprot:TRINITY_DN6376_c0_g2_i1.p1 TRINITY_DN6376_c0_g2~~TRINITY_DN6376_c0_g2_i1.p1  ORF type:complete len:301 (-),score=41.16 TRINITY_DN6376_c0_g2_i1:118-1020(-)